MVDNNSEWEQPLEHNIECHEKELEEWNECMENEPNMRYILALSNIIVAVVILLSCSAIFTVILVQRKQRKPSNNFILSLCLTDFMVTLIVCPHYVTAAVLGKWPSSFRHCQLLAFVTTLCGGMSILNLTLIAGDRMTAIFRPTKYRVYLSDPNCRLAIALCWVYSAGIASFTFIVDFSKPVFDGDRGSCLLTGQGFVILQFCTMAVPGFLLTVSCYVYIVIKMKQQSVFTKKSNRINYEVRMAKIGGMVSLFFLLTYIPYYSLMMFPNLTDNPIMKSGTAALVMVSYIVDAVMYGYCNTQYRREIVRILRRACCIKGPCKNYVEPGRRNSDTRFTQADSTVIPNSCTNGSSHDCGVKGCTHNVIIQPTINENIIGENGDSTVIPNSEALQ